MDSSPIPRILTLILFFFGLIYAFAVPPFQAPDEPAHFARAYGIAEGQFILRDHPPELVSFILSSLDKYYEISAVPLLNDMKSMINAQNDRVPNVSYNTSQYSFIPYLLHAGVIKIVMLIVEHPRDLIVSLYLCRMFTLFLFCLSFLIAATIAPSFAMIFFWVAATPMALSQGSVVSTDFLVFCSGILLLSMSVAKVKPLKFMALGMPSVFVLLVSKPPYALLVFVPLLSSVFDRNRGWYKFAGLIIACASAFAVGYIWKEIVMTHGIYAHTMEYIQTYRSQDVSPSQQLTYIINNPIHFFYVLWNTLILCGPELFHQFVGVLGWQDLYLPRLAVFAWGLVLVYVLAVSSGARCKGNFKQKTVGICLVVSGVLTAIAIVAALYLIWMPVGADAVEAQGRYFHMPALAIFVGLLLLFPETSWSRSGSYLSVVVIAAAGSIINICAITMAIYRYWL